MGDISSSEEPETFHKLKQINNQHVSLSNQQNLCEVSVTNNGVCPECQSKVKLKTGDGEVLWQKDYNHSTIVSWAPLLSDGKCHGAILKVWEWRHLATTIKTAKPPSAMNRRTTRSSLVSEEIENLETEPTYIEKENEDEIHQKISLEENSTSDSHEKLEIPSEVFMKSPQKVSQENLINTEGRDNHADFQPPTTLESPRARRDFLHKLPEQYHERSVHRHHNKQNSASHENHSQHTVHFASTEEHLQPDNTHDQENLSSRKASTTASVPSSFPGSMRTMHTTLAPPGYELQQIHERLALLRSNGTVWHEETLTSLGLGITRLCRSENSCLPSMKSHSKSGMSLIECLLFSYFNQVSFLYIPKTKKNILVLVEPPKSGNFWT